jgi:hypothetical protein
LYCQLPSSTSNRHGRSMWQLLLQQCGCSHRAAVGVHSHTQAAAFTNRTYNQQAH